MWGPPRRHGADGAGSKARCPGRWAGGRGAEGVRALATTCLKASDQHDFPALVDKPVPGVAAMVEDTRTNSISLGHVTHAIAPGPQCSRTQTRVTIAAQIHVQTWAIILIPGRLIEYAPANSEPFPVLRAQAVKIYVGKLVISWFLVLVLRHHKIPGGAALQALARLFLGETARYRIGRVPPCYTCNPLRAPARDAERRVDPILQDVRGAKHEHAPRQDGGLFAGHRVAPDALALLAHREAAE